MGFKFGGTSFSIGIVEIAIDHIDTDKLTTTIRISWPVLDGTMSIKLYSGINWQNTRGLSVDVNFNQNRPPEKEEKDGIDEYDNVDSDEDA